jgi:hypothetical protein
MFATKPYWENTGGGCMVQVMELTPQAAKELGLGEHRSITISDEVVSLYNKLDDFWEGEDCIEYHTIGADSNPYLQEGHQSCIKAVSAKGTHDYTTQVTRIELVGGYVIEIDFQSVKVEGGNGVWQPRL